MKTFSLSRARIAQVSRATLASLALVSLACLATGCKISQPGERIDDPETSELPRTTELRVVAHQGGLHRGMLLLDSVWYQGFGSTLLALEPSSGAELFSLELAPIGASGGISSLFVAPSTVQQGSMMYAVLDGDYVIALDRANPAAPREVSRFGVREIGFRPREVSFADGRVWIAGDGGAVALSDVRTIDEFQSQVNAAIEADDPEKVPLPVAPTPLLQGEIVRSLVDAEGGAVACCGRRVKRVATGEFLGAATKLVPLEANVGGGYAYVLQAKTGAEVGIKDAKFLTRDFKALRATVAGVAVIDNRFYAWNSFEVATWPIELQESALRLGTLLSIPVRGARDVARVRQNHFAVAGSFGRSLYRFRAEGGNPADVFYYAHREPSRLEVSTTDRRRILAGFEDEGWWLWTIGEGVELVAKGVASATPLATRVDGAWGGAQISEDGLEVMISSRSNTVPYQLADGVTPTTLALIGAELWIGHSDGIDIVRPVFALPIEEKSSDEKSAAAPQSPKINEITRVKQFRFDGPVNAIYPNRVGGGASYCALWSGFGSIRSFRFVDVDADGKEDPKPVASDKETE